LVLPHRPAKTPEVLVPAAVEERGAQRYLLATVVSRSASAINIAIIGQFLWPSLVVVFDYGQGAKYRGAGRGGPCCALGRTCAPEALARSTARRYGSVPQSARYCRAVAR